MNLVRNLAFVVIAAIFSIGGLLALDACSGQSSQSSQQTAQGQGTVKMFITDAATDKFNQILVTITKITLISPDGSQQVVSAKTQTIDLRKITDFSQFLAQNGITTGTYSEIRLDVSGIVLNQIDSNGNIIDTQSVTLPSGKIDINPQQTISVAGGGQQTVELDFDANNSFKLVTTGNGKVIFRPVIFVHQLGEHETQPGRMVKEHGAITSPDLQAGTFKLCSIDHEQTDECLNVAFDDTTAMYDSSLASITSDGLIENTEVTVFGHLVKDSSGSHIQASILVLGPDGTLTTAGGLVSTAPDSNEKMTVNIKVGQSVPSGDTSVQLVKTVQIFSRASGDALATTDLVTGTEIMVIGQYDSNTKLFTAIAVSVADQSTEVQGTVTAVNTPQGSQTTTLTVDTSTGPQCVDVNQDTRIAIHDSKHDDVASFGQISSITVGQTISANGTFGSDQCLAADHLVIGSGD